MATITLKSKLQIINGLNREITDLKPDETNGVLRLCNNFSDEPELLARLIATFLTYKLPFGVQDDLIKSIIFK